MSFEIIRPTLFGRQQMGKSTCLLNQHLGLSESPMLIQFTKYFSRSSGVGWMVARTRSCVGERGWGGEEGGAGIFQHVLSSLKIFTPPFLLSSLPHSSLSKLPAGLWHRAEGWTCGGGDDGKDHKNTYNNGHLHGAYHVAGTVARVLHAFLQ